MRHRTLSLALFFSTSAALLTAGPAVGESRTPSDTYSLPSTCRNPYTEAQEVALGDKVVREVYRTEPVLPDSAPLAQYIRRLGAQLVAAAPATPGLEEQWPFNFHVVASDEINAFALPGGTMFVDLGAIQAAQTEAQLAGVMAHEMSHVILRHSTCNLVRQQHKSLLYGLGAVGSSIFLGSAGGGLVNAAQNLDFMHMSRGDEKQADMLGVQIVYNAGFDPRGLPQFFEIIAAKYGQGGRQFLSDHPNPGNRTEYLNAEIATLPPLQRPVVSSANFTAAHQDATRLPALTAAELKTGAWKSSGLYAPAPGAPARPASAVNDPVAQGEAAVREADAAGSGFPAPGGSPGSNSGAPTASGLPPLSSAQLGLNRTLVHVQGGSFSIAAPPNWIRTDTANAGDLALRNALTLAPLGARGNFGLAYGAVLGVVPQPGQGIGDDDALHRAFEAFGAQLSQSHSLQVDGPVTPLQVGGQQALSRYYRGASPVGSTSAAERDWLILVTRPDGDADVLLFVSPLAQFASLSPLFNSMLGTFNVQ